MINAEEVRAAYRWLLGRAPESAEVIDWHRGKPDITALREELLASAEFAALFEERRVPLAEKLAVRTDRFPALAQIEYDADDATLDRMWTRIAESWTGLGEEAPEWSVMSLDAFRPERIEDNRDVFEQTAGTDAALVDAALARLPGFEPGKATCVEIGCGVGRVTLALAERFASVRAADVSEAHLRRARERLDTANVPQISWRRIAERSDYTVLAEGADFVFSNIVLQHNPPPLQQDMLRRLLGGLAPGGAALFQAITFIESYSFAIDDYLDTPATGMEVHAFAQERLFALLREAGCELIEMQQDDAAGESAGLRSHVLLVRKG